MAIEIERKFLVSGDFLPEAVSSTRIVQGYICSQPGRTVRIRIRGEEGFLTIKGASDEKGLSRYEFEQKIPLVDAERLLELCEPGAIDKVRYLVPRGSHTWEVDVFHGANEGLILADPFYNTGILILTYLYSDATLSGQGDTRPNRRFFGGWPR